MTDRARRLQLGFLSFVPTGPDGPARALADGLDLFALAEDLGYDTGWVRNRHFETFLSSPLVFLTAAAQRTRRLHLGTGVIPMRYEDPVRLAEDALTADLLSGGRLEVGLSTGIAPTAAVLDPVFGPSEASFAAESAARTARFRDAVAGRSLGTSSAPLMSLPAGSPLVVTPRSPADAPLAERVWYGAGSRDSAARTGAAGMDLQVSTLNTEETGEPFDVVQAAQVRAFRAAAAGSDRAATGWAPRASAGRIVLPLLTAADRAAHAEFLGGYTSRMHPDGRPLDAPGAGAAPAVPGPAVRFSPALAGDPDAVVEALLADAALPEVDQLVITLPAPGGPAAHAKVLRDVAERVAPHLGWSPAA